MKPFTALACVILGFIAVMQLVRLLMGWDIVVNQMHVPLWPSGVVAVLFGVIALMAWRERRG
jgi:hypothetical protein